MTGRFTNRSLACCLALLSAGVLARAQQGPGGGHPPGGGMGHSGIPSPGFGPGMNGHNRSARDGDVPPRTGSLTTRSGIKLGPPGRWWDDSTVSRQIGLNRDQQKSMDAIFAASKPAILDTYQSFIAEKARLATVAKDPKSDQGQLFSAIDAVNQARASLEKATMQMLLQIRGQLDPAQLAKLDALP